MANFSLNLESPCKILTHSMHSHMHAEHRGHAAAVGDGGFWSHTLISSCFDLQCATAARLQAAAALRVLQRSAAIQDLNLDPSQNRFSHGHQGQVGKTDPEDLRARSFLGTASRSTALAAP